MNAPSSDKRRRGPWLIAAVVLVPLVAIVAVYLVFFTGDSPDKLTLSDTPATQPGGTATTTGNGAATGLEGTWNVAQGSSPATGCKRSSPACRPRAMHGVTKDVTIPLDIRLTGAQGEVVGSLKFPFSDFGMSAPSIGGFVSVDSDATLEFKLLLTRG